MNKSLKKNFIYNIMYQLLTIIMPLITTPYIARVIGPTGSGTYSYTYSIVSYFVLFAMLGINNYGNRLIAKIRDDKSKLSKEFSSLFYLHIFVSIIVLICYAIYVILWGQEYLLAFIIQSIYILSAMIDINWLFFGLEEFKVTVTRNIIIRLLLTIGIFVFVRNSDDLLLYIFILAISNLLSNLVLLFFLKKKDIRLVKVKLKDMKKHLKPLILLFVPVISVSIYKLMDKIMLGQMINVTEVGYYEYAERIINLPMSLITALGTVMLPRMSNLVSTKNIKELKKYINKSIQFVMFISIPLSIGIILVSKTFVPFFLGNSYYETIALTQIIALTVPVISWANVIRTQYLLPTERDKEYTISIICGAGINFALNSILIPRYGAIGAATATVFTEICIMVYQTIIVRAELDIKKYLHNTLPFFIKAIFMGIVVYFIGNLPFSPLIICITQVVAGVLIYFIMNLSYIVSFIPVDKIVKLKNK